MENNKDTPVSQVDPLAEIEAMRVVAGALKGLPPTSQRRVLEWATDSFQCGQLRPTSKVHESGSRAPRDSSGSPERNEETAELATLFARAKPETDSEKALVVGYWLKVTEHVEEFDGFRVNSELKHLGHRVKNITQALTGLMRMKPQQVVQTRKEGKSKQARKKYKLTVEGIRRVELMLEGETDEG